MSYPLIKACNLYYLAICTVELKVTTRCVWAFCLVVLWLGLMVQGLHWMCGKTIH